MRYVWVVLVNDDGVVYGAYSKKNNAINAINPKKELIQRLVYKGLWEFGNYEDDEFWTEYTLEKCELLTGTKRVKEIRECNSASKVLDAIDLIEEELEENGKICK